MQITIDSVLETLCNQWAYVVLYFASATLLSAVALNFQEQRQRGVQPLRAERDVVATSFHPGITGDLRLHRLFVQIVEG